MKAVFSAIAVFAGCCLVSSGAVAESAATVAESEISAAAGTANKPAAAGKEASRQTDKPDIDEIFKQKGSQIIIDSSGIYTGGLTVDEIQALFDEVGYDRYVKPEGNSYPRFFVKDLPAGLGELTDRTYRNQVFIKILVPLALKVNQEVLEEREDLLAIRQGFEETGDFHELDEFYLERLAEKYEVVTPFKDSRRYLRLLNELLRRVDAVPPSILVSAAAIYTDWGSSRIARLANNLYKQRSWYTQEGLVSAAEPEEPYRYTVYPALEDSIRAYVLKINTDVNYEQFWNARRVSRNRGSILYGKRLDWGMILDSNLTNFAGLLDYTLTYYNFSYLDEAELEDEYGLED